MKQLDRSPIAAPVCLGSYAHGAHNWASVTPADKGQIRGALESMQGTNCAYCEGALETLGRHIEHFRRKHNFPHLTFAWVNLFLSCDAKDSCGHFKDHGAGPYNPADLIDPCADQPDQYFRFRTDGSVSVRSGLSATDARRATETLRVFALDPQHGRLRRMRKSAVSGYVALADDAADFTRDELQELFEVELAATANGPFSTAIRHVLTEP